MEAIASTDLGAVREAERQIKLILDPPTADLGATYRGRVVNITKFGAFVNILPGRDGLVHISKLGGGRRIDRVEDVLELGEEIDVVVEDVDPNGKISLVLKSSESDGGAPPRRRESSRPSRDAAPSGERRGDGPRRDSHRDGAGRDGRADREGGFGRGDRDSGRGEPRRDDRGGSRTRQPAPVASANAVSFEDSFDSDLQQEFGDLGPDPRARRGGRRNPRGPR